eukprot:NODE_179_length_15798_cov_0.379769.p4 type:complete len:392 gc:universal NODE_179_length_15798_cov_0.379769:3344-2169(-)
MFEIFFILLKLILDFCLLALFMNHRKKAFIQIRMPTMVTMLVFITSLINILDSFIRFDNQRNTRYLSCYVYGFTYSILCNWAITLFMIMISRIYIRASKKETKLTDLLYRITSNVSGLTNDVINWDNPVLMKKLRRQKITSLSLLFIVPPILNTLVYFLILGQNLGSGHGVYECKPYANILSAFFYVIQGVFSLILIQNINFKHDIFKMKWTLYSCITSYSLFGVFILFDFAYSLGSGSYTISWWFMTMYLGVLMWSYTILPVYLSSQRIPSKLTIESIWKNKDTQNRFKSICSSSFCSNYIAFLQDYEHLDMSKPLLIQKISKKYFDSNSPYYLDLLLESLNSWYLDLKQPDSYVFRTVQKHVMIFLQDNVVVYMDTNTLDKEEMKLLTN